MVIKTLEATYTVQSQLPYTGDNRVYVCEKEGENNLFLLVEITDKEVIKTSVDYLSSAKRMSEFSDFVDCFFAEENFYSVFTYYNSRVLGDILHEDAPPLPRRLAMMRELLEKWVLLKLPPYFAYDSAKAERVRFAAGDKGVLAFGLSDLKQHDEITFARVQARFAELMETVFAEEFEKESVPQLKSFEQSLLQGVHEDIPALYVAFNDLESDILRQPEVEWKAPKTWPFRLWEKIKTTFPGFKRVLQIVLLAGAFLILIISIRRSMFSGEQNRQFERIGTLEIHEASQPKKTEEKGFIPWQILSNLLNE